MVLTQVTKFAGDLFIHFESLEYCTRGEKVTAQAGTANIANVIGYPLIFAGGKYKLALAADSANITHLIVRGPAIVDLLTTADSPIKYQILVHPPAILNQDKLPINDYAGNPFVQADLIAKLKTLGYEMRQEPAHSTYGDFNG